MSKTKKVWLTVAGILTALGLVTVGIALAAGGGDREQPGGTDNVNHSNYVSHSYEISGDFDGIDILAQREDIELVLTDGVCRVVCQEAENSRHTVQVQSGTLRIAAEREKWYDLSLSARPKTTVYLPRDSYAALHIDGGIGSVSIPADFTFGSVAVEVDTGDILCLASASGLMELETDTGSIRAEGLRAASLHCSADTGSVHISSAAIAGELDVETNTGKLDLTEISCASLEAESKTGSIRLQSVVAAGALTIEGGTGSVQLEDSDAGQLFIETSTGSVTGTLRTGKQFIVEGAHGRVSVPNSTGGGRCEIKTSTGDIHIEI